jgi:hypothetical protein
VSREISSIHTQPGFSFLVKLKAWDSKTGGVVARPYGDVQILSLLPIPFREACRAGRAKKIILAFLKKARIMLCRSRFYRTLELTGGGIFDLK